MSIFKVKPDDVSTFTVVTTPLREYVSSSNPTIGVSGSVFVFARHSTIEKDPNPVSSFIDSTHDEMSLEATLHNFHNVGKYARVTGSSSAFILTSSQTFSGMVSDYMSKVNASSTSTRKQTVLNVNRFTPSVTWSDNTVKKLIIKDQMSSYHRVAYPSANWAYTNYNCLNFFTASTVPSSSCLMYPNLDDSVTHTGYVTGTYVPSGPFSFDFYINPCYRPHQVDGDIKTGSAFHAGTILHLSSTYALSLITGSLKDENGRPAAYRLQLQLSHSADVKPSQTVAGAALNNLVFRSDDNSLLFNRWHHVVVRWGTATINYGTGTFNIDGVDKGVFVVPSSTIAPRTFSSTGLSQPNVLFVGNYYEGRSSGSNSTSMFFAADPALRDGLQQLDATTGVDAPTTFRFDHPLNARIHDLAIRRRYLTDADIAASASHGPSSIDEQSTAFYLPPFFVEDAPFRQFVNTHGGILQTPFFEIDGTTNDPFNVALSFGVNGHYINIENFLRDFAGNVFPRCHQMTASAIATTTEVREANQFLYDQSFVRRRNSFILPCDDGLFVPAFELIASESMRTNSVDDLGTEELSFIHLDNMLLTQSLLFGSDFDEDTTFADESIGYTPEQPGLSPGKASLNQARLVDAAVASGTFDAGVQDNAPLTIFQRTRDPSSNQVTFFDVSNLFYGKRIYPGSLTLSETTSTGSGDSYGMTLKDDGRGTLYAANCLTSASTWNSVGTVFYDEGIIAIKSPHLYFFGKEGYTLTFKGEQNIHVMSFEVTAPANHLNSSSNLNYQKVPPSPFPNDPETEFVYISGINFHDDNLNVVMKTQLAQPIMKRPGQKIRFRVKVDL